MCANVIVGKGDRSNPLPVRAAVVHDQVEMNGELFVDHRRCQVVAPVEYWRGRLACGRLHHSEEQAVSNSTDFDVRGQVGWEPARRDDAHTEPLE